MGRRRRGGRGRTQPAAGRKLLINARESAESRIAVLEGGRLEEYYIERGSLGSTLGNIYKARITNIEKSIGAAFVEFGHNRQGFLHVSDLCVAAVAGDQARLLLAGVQAAREHAHDEDVVDAGPPVARRASPEGDVVPDGEDRDVHVAHEDADDDAGVDADDEGDDDIEVAAPGFDSTEELGGPQSLLDPSEDDADDEEDEDPAQDGVADDESYDESEDAFLARRKAESVAFARSAQWEEGLTARDGSPPGDEHAPPAESGYEHDPGDAADDDADEQSGDANAGESRGGDGGDSDRGGRRRRRGRRAGRTAREPREARAPREMPPIHEILQKGQEVVVQVIKDGIGTKGPTLTTYLSIPGRFVVLMPGINKRGVSRKVTDPGERERLKQIVRELDVPDGLGFIVRTAGTGASREDLQRDLDYLLRAWDQMRTRMREHTAPVLLYQENDLVIRTLRDLYDGQGEVVIDDKPTLEKARQFMGAIMPAAVEQIRHYDGDVPLFAHFNIETEIARLLEMRVELRSGASLVIEQTEALVAIDVNSGRFKAEGGNGIEDTAIAVNSEAAVEIARQIRLRDLGGVVVVDFIDMRAERHRKQVESVFKEALRRDRARIKVARFSPFGIIELTRQRVRPSLKRSVHQRCPYCQGTGYIPSDETSCLTVIRKIRENLQRPGAVLVVTLRPEVAEAVVNSQRKTLVELEHESRKTIFVRSDHRLAYEDIEVRAMVALPDDLDHRHG